MSTTRYSSPSIFLDLVSAYMVPWSGQHRSLSGFTDPAQLRSDIKPQRQTRDISSSDFWLRRYFIFLLVIVILRVDKTGTVIFGNGAWQPR